MTASIGSDNLTVWTTSDPQSLPAASSAMMTSVRAALDARAIRSYKWANSTERGNATGMTEGDLGDQRDTDTIWRYDGAAWQPLIAPSVSYPVTLQGVAALGNGVLTGSYSRVGKMVTVEGSLRVGSSTTFNTSNIAVSLPVDAASKYAAATGLESMVGGCGILNPGVLAFSGPVAMRADNTQAANLKFQAIFNNQVVDSLAKQGSPVTLANGHLVTWTFAYEAA